MAELPNWRDAQPVTLTKLTAFDALAEIAEEAAQLERHLQDRIDEREQVSREKLSNDPEVQAEAFLVSKEAEARVRILRGAFFLPRSHTSNSKSWPAGVRLTQRRMSMGALRMVAAIACSAHSESCSRVGAEDAGQADRAWTPQPTESRP